MKKIIIGIIFLLIGAGALGYWFVKGRQMQPAALQITSLPKATVFFDGEEMGKTPLREDVPTGDHTVRVVPEGLDASFEQKFTFLPNILTVIDRMFGEIGQHGHALSLEPLEDKESVHITVISTPTGAAVTLDSELKGITPILLQEVTASDHELVLTKEGYQDKIIRVRAVKGYKLVTTADLAVKQALESALPTPTATPAAALLGTQSAQLVRIGQTPNNFLRVREEPSLTAREVARVKPGETFPLLEEKTSWYRIKLPANIEGWISSQFAQKISE